MASSQAQSNNIGDPNLLIESLRPFAETVAEDLRSLPEDRKKVLKPAAAWAVHCLQQGEEANFTFICTANSRRSHLGQVWAKVAAEYYGLPGVDAFSGGIEVTACNERTIATLKRAGLTVVTDTVGKNPVYLVTFSNESKPIRAYSKTYNTKENPQKDYAAMMCCADADEECPVVEGCAVRIPLHYVDPKVGDNTADETKTYDERSRQIATEMFYVMSLVKQGMSKLFV